ncbi:hypothetical protein [Mycolicibacterium sp.]
MTNDRRSRRRKKARRETGRNAGSGQPTFDTLLTDSVRRALSCGHPLGLLSLASELMEMGRPARGEDRLDSLLTLLIKGRNRETTALLAVMGELLVDDLAAQSRCRREVAERRDLLPRWIKALPQVKVHRAARRTHVLGHLEALMIGARLDGRKELTISLLIDHDVVSSVVDASISRDPINDVLTQLADQDSDVEVTAVSLAAARAQVRTVLARPIFESTIDGWPLCQLLVCWLVARLPEGGEYQLPATDWEHATEVRNAFFETESAAPFKDCWHRDLLLELFESGTGDPLRWSTDRVHQIVGGSPFYEDYIPLEVALDTPDLLRVFIPYAYAQSGIRDELTARAVAVIDRERSNFKRKLLQEARDREFRDVV